MKQDLKNIIYFDNCKASWSPGRYRHALTVLNGLAGPEDSLIDIGCGSGNILKFILENTPVSQVTGMDPSRRYLEAVRQRVNCETILGSILDKAVATDHAARYDFAMMGDVLHHLVGKSRSASQKQAQQAVENSLELLKEGGYLLIMEPLFRPKILVVMVFYLKVLVTVVLGRRFELFGRRWLNMGAPVVSFYDQAQLTKMIKKTTNAFLVEKQVAPPKKIGPGIRHSRMTFVIQKRSSSNE